MIERRVGGESDGAAKLRDRLGQLAGLMRDQTEQMHGIGSILRLQDFPAHRRSVVETPRAAVLLRARQQVGKRRLLPRPGRLPATGGIHGCPP